MEIDTKSLFSESFTITLSKFMLIFWCGSNILIPLFEKLSLEPFGDQTYFHLIEPLELYGKLENSTLKQLQYHV